MKKYSIEQIVCIIVIVLGVITSLIQFLYNPDLWFDEAALAVNIIQKNSHELLRPLDYEQVAPILFLQIEKLFSSIWPNSEYGLRLFSLLCFWASILFFNKIIKKQSNNIYARTVAVSFFALGYIFIWYSSEVKQYMSDVFVLLCVFYFLLKDYKKDRNKYWLLGIIGMLAIFLSNVAPIILFTCGIYLFYDDKFSQLKKSLLPLFSVFIIWLATFLLYYYFFIYKHPLQEFMVKFWSNAEAFLPSNPVTSDFYVFIFKKVPVTIFSAIHGLNESKMQTMIVVLGLVLLFIAGIINLIRHKNVGMIIISCVPVLLHLLLSAFQLYPFERRLILYTLPNSIVVCAFGFDYILNVVFPKLKIEKIKSYILVFFVSIICVTLFVRFPLGKGQTRNIKECLRYIGNTTNIDADADADADVYVLHTASVGFRYYKDIGYLNKELNIIGDEKIHLSNYGNYFLNKEHLHGLYINDLKMLQHSKVWLLMIGDLDIDFLNKIDSLGYNRIKEFEAGVVRLYLYDFGE